MSEYGILAVRETPSRPPSYAYYLTDGSGAEQSSTSFEGKRPSAVLTLLSKEGWKVVSATSLGQIRTDRGMFYRTDYLLKRR
jgi:hypothetical protein